MADNKKNISAKDVILEKDKVTKEEKYNQYVTEMTPKHNWMKVTIRAFFVGGIICIIGQGFMNLYEFLGATKENSSLYTTITLILISVILTGFGIYPKIAKFAGAGTVVPITGFANSVAAPAVEFKKEGQVFGIGCKIFTIAGPVILYGIVFSWILGIIYMIIQKIGGM